ncbi:glycosyltransferase [Nocardioides sp. CER19]|uniref:glycosyltransferase n=1 Tax=Nocardioides sp. CER19 TaxID=3038538 RepID=UPI00244C9E5C|nr:glycosyltransferase [Nocardioides sp. CER19]MDH2415620.1 glycosyltransferase [Nocardioides sp. CER19]
MRVLCATTANDGHFGPLLPFARACAVAGHEVRVAAPASYATAVASAGFHHEPFADAPAELIGPVMARLPTVSFEEANDLVVREVFARIDAQAALPSLTDTVERWRPDIVIRETAELASLGAAERFGVPHVHACIGMHEVASRFAESVADPLEDLERRAGLDAGQAAAALATETVLTLVPEGLDRATDHASPEARQVLRFHEPADTTESPPLPDWGDRDAPLIYVTFGSVTGSLAPFAGVFREALDALAEVEARVMMTVGRKVDVDGLGPLPTNAFVVPWWPQDAVLPHAAAMLGHGGFGTTLGALAAGVPQVVAPIFSFDQAVNGEHVASVGAGLTVGLGPGVVERGAAQIPRLLEDPAYAASAREVATAIRALPPSAEVVGVLESIVS